MNAPTAFAPLALEVRRGETAEEPSEDGKALFTWRSACRFITENCHRPIGRKDVARFLRIHPCHVSRLFARFSGQSFGEVVKNLRLERARALLCEPGLNVSEVAESCGFGTVNNFIRRFRAQYGLPPGKARAALAFNSTSR